MTDLQQIPLNRLVHAKANVRKTGRDLGIEGLMVSIGTHGLRQNLNVRATSGSRFEVVAGGRRLEAMRRLAKAGKLAAATPVPCQVLAEDDNPVEISLVENAHRSEMHPDDECNAFAELADGGMSLEDIGARFGVSEVVVRRRLRLARVSPKLRKLHRDGEVSLAQMMALALVDDHAAQEQAWSALPDYHRDPRSLRRYLTQEGMSANHRLARFVGVEAYEEAGGVVLRDLFEDEVPVLADAMLVERLALAKLEAAAKLVRAEGWVWVKVALQNDYEPYDRIYPENEGDAYELGDMERAGAKVTLTYDGTIQIDRGLVEPTEPVKEKRGTDENGIPTYSEAVLTDLTAHKSAALRLELARNPKVALAAVVHGLGLGLLYHTGLGTCLDLSARSSNLEARIHSPDECSAHPALGETIAAWRECLPADADGFWAWCLEADTEKLSELLALLAGLTVDASYSKGAAAVLGEALGLDMRKHWAPKVEGFFGRLSKPLMEHLLTEVGEEVEAAKLAGLKKGEAASNTAVLLTAREWLPAVLA